MIRWLNSGEIEKLTPIVAERGWDAFDPGKVRVLADLDVRGEVLGFVVVKLIPVVGPLLAEAGNASSLAGRLREELEKSDLGGYLVVAEHPFSEKFCVRAGMHRLDFPVFVKRCEGC